MKHILGTRVRKLVVIGGIALLAFAPSVRAVIAYGNNYGSSGVYKVDIDLAAGTATLLQTYITGSTSNGRGAVVVGNILYTTDANLPRIYRYDLNTNTQLSFITTTKVMSTLAWDGSAFWTTSYGGAPEGYRIDTSGTVLKTVSFSQSTTYMDGMEYFNGKLIVNKTDGGYSVLNGYSVYDTDGVLLAANVFSVQNGAGIAYDGTNFYVSNVYGGSGSVDMSVFDGNTYAFIKTINYTGNSWGVEDLSVDYATRVDTGGGNTPDGGTSVLLFGGALALGGFAMKRRIVRSAV